MANLRRFFTVAQELLRNIFCAVEIDIGRSFTARLRCSTELWGSVRSSVLADFRRDLLKIELFGRRESDFHCCGYFGAGLGPLDIRMRRKTHFSIDN